MTQSDLEMTDLLLLREAVRRPNGLPIWVLTSKIGLTITEAANSFRKLRDIGFLGEKDSEIRILKPGRDWVLVNQHRFTFSGKKVWREVPDRFIRDRHEPFEPYAPKISKLDKSNFKFAETKNR